MVILVVIQVCSRTRFHLYVYRQQTPTV